MANDSIRAHNLIAHWLEQQLGQHRARSDQAEGICGDIRTEVNAVIFLIIATVLVAGMAHYLSLIPDYLIMIAVGLVATLIFILASSINGKIGIVKTQLAFSSRMASQEIDLSGRFIRELGDRFQEDDSD